MNEDDCKRRCVLCVCSHFSWQFILSLAEADAIKGLLEDLEGQVGHLAGRIGPFVSPVLAAILLAWQLSDHISGGVTEFVIL